MASISTMSHTPFDVAGDHHQDGDSADGDEALLGDCGERPVHADADATEVQHDPDDGHRPELRRCRLVGVYRHLLECDGVRMTPATIGACA